MGDGIIGSYGVASILQDAGFRDVTAAHVLCANDLVAAWGGVRWFGERGMTVDVVAGPATDNSVGLAYVRDELGVPASNARTDPEQFVDLVERAAFERADLASADGAGRDAADALQEHGAETGGTGGEP
jgi:hypothetical protein